MQVVRSETEMVEAMERCAREAQAAFGNGALLIEKLISEPRHIEVQILGDGTGEVLHLFERDCSIQQRHQKVIEIAPAPNLSEELRSKILSSAVALGKAVNYENAGTIEFSVDPASNRYYFIECNPRIQVEHTVTEEVVGADLVAVRFQIASGASFSNLGWENQSSLPEPKGFSIQARVVTQGSGTIADYREPSGLGVRVDASAYTGYTVSGQFDPLVAKVITTNRFPGTFESTAREALRNVNEYQITGSSTNLSLLRSILEHDAFKSAKSTSFNATRVRTNFIYLLEQNVSQATRTAPELVDFLEKNSGRPGIKGDLKLPVVTSKNSIPIREPDEFEVEVTCPIESTWVETIVKSNEFVDPGQTLITVSAMKMETNVTAPVAGRVTDAIGDETGRYDPSGTSGCFGRYGHDRGTRGFGSERTARTRLESAA